MQGGGIPQIRFICPKANLDNEATFAAIYMSRNVKEEFTKYSGSNTKLTVVHVLLFKLIVEKYNFCKEQEIVELLLNNLQLEYNAHDTCACRRA